MFMREDGEKIIKFILQNATVFYKLCAYIFGGTISIRKKVKVRKKR